MNQETDITKKAKNFFQVQFPANSTKFEQDKVTQLVLKNLTTTSGDIWLEGSIKQIRNFLKTNLIVKPACMFDNKISATFKISFSQSEKYNDKNIREVTVPLAQVQAQAIRQEFDHQYKYRFLLMDENNNLKPLYSKEQIVPGGAGDLMITITGLPGSGFEQCDPTP
jgi:hypothetical protein